MVESLGLFDDESCSFLADLDLKTSAVSGDDWDSTFNLTAHVSFNAATYITPFCSVRASTTILDRVVTIIVTIS